MSKKKYFFFFSALFIPVLIASTLISIAYNLQAHDYIEIDWFVVVVLTILLDILIIWRQRNGEKVNSKC